MIRSSSTIGILLAAFAVFGVANTAAADCQCSQPILEETRCTDVADTVQIESDLRTGYLRQTSAPQPIVPLWCERSDDPRCMPGGLPADAGLTWFALTPVASSSLRIERTRERPFSFRINDASVSRTGVRDRIDRPPA